MNLLTNKALNYSIKKKHKQSEVQLNTQKSFCEYVKKSVQLKELNTIACCIPK